MLNSCENFEIDHTCLNGALPTLVFYQQGGLCFKTAKDILQLRESESWVWNSASNNKTDGAHVINDSKSLML